MIRSMTGYGRGESITGDRKFTAEIKSVNHRYNDISIKLPRGMAEFEDAVKKQLLTEIARGKTDVYVSFESFSKNDVTVRFNEPVADALVLQLKEMKERFNTCDDVSLNVLTRFPEILAVERSAFGQEAKDAILTGLTDAVKAALKMFTDMRETEGASLKADILNKLSAITGFVEAIKRRAPHVAVSYRERLMQKITEFTAEHGIETPADEARLMAEILFYADKSCIDEEITRLVSHINQMRGMLSEKEAVGRKLDFLAQEMNREINTIGSKANDMEIASTVVDLKSELEKIREQIQNIE